MIYPAKCNSFQHDIGDQYLTRGKHPRLCTITDKMEVIDSKGTVRKRFYVSKHEFSGQWVFDYDVCNATVTRGKHALEDKIYATI